MVQPSDEVLSVRQQCQLLHLARSGLYYQPVEVSAEERALMRRIDALYLERPYYGSRRVTVALRQQGHGKHPADRIWRNRAVSCTLRLGGDTWKHAISTYPVRTSWPLRQSSSGGALSKRHPYWQNGRRAV